MSERVSLSDVEAKLRELGGGVQTTAAKVTSPVLGGAVVAAVLAVAAVYMLGRRRGRKEAPILEIRRV